MTLELNTDYDSDPFHHQYPIDEIPEYRFSRENIRALDHAAINDYHIPVLVLMENAAHNITYEIISSELDRDIDEYRPVLIICGKGNNGGDGLATARHLVNADFSVVIALTFDPEETNLSSEVRTHLQIAQKMRIPIIILDKNTPDATLDQFLGSNHLKHQSLLIVDAMLGTGVTSSPRPPYDRMVHWINTRSRQHDSAVIAVDIPTGLDCDTGNPLGKEAVRADLTICLAGYKDACFEPQARPYFGAIVLGEIGVPQSLLRQFGQPVCEEDLPW